MDRTQIPLWMDRAWRAEEPVPVDAGRHPGSVNVQLFQRATKCTKQYQFYVHMTLIFLGSTHLPDIYSPLLFKDNSDVVWGSTVLNENI